MTNYDYNDAEEQRGFDVIPGGTIVAVDLAIRPGGHGDGGWLRLSKDGTSAMLDCEITVIDGEYVKRKIWVNFTLSGTTEGHAKATQISRSKIRAMLESARGIRPDDRSEQAVIARRLRSYADLHGLRFLVKTGIEPERNGYPARNTILEIVTPDRSQWRSVAQAQKASVSTPAVPTERPAWAR